MKALIALFILVLSLAAIAYINLFSIKTANCPAKEGYYILPRTFPGKSLFLGYSADYFQKDFVTEVIKSVVDQQLEIDVNILIPKSEVKEAFQDLEQLRKKPYKSFVKLSASPTDEALWVQDYMEHAIDLKSKEDFIIELPYLEREGEVMPKAISILKGWELIEAPKLQDHSTESFSDPDYGGNIEALPYGFVLIGDSMANTLKLHLKKILRNQSLLEVPIQWVENNHVDEIFTLLPSSESKCGFSIGYASPKMAMDIMSQQTEDKPLWSQLYERANEDNTYPFDHCMGSKSFFECDALVQANNKYEKLINTAKDLVAEGLQSKCSDLKMIPFPQLFMPVKSLQVYGTQEDIARALNPSIINNLLVGKHIFYSRQEFTPFEQESEKIFKDLGLVPKALESRSLQSSGGGFHCASLMANTCK